MKIPEIRDELFKMAEDLKIPRLRELAEELWRRPVARRAPAESRYFTDDLADKIRAYAKQHPDHTYAAIGLAFNVNQGRVSEAIAGKRD